MTATRPPAPLPPIADKALGLFAWAGQATAAATYLTITCQPSVWRSVLKQDPFSTVCAWVILASTVALWAVSLYQEQKHFYDRRSGRLNRKMSTISQGIVLVFAAAAAAEQKERVALWAFMGLFALCSTMFWATWMHTKRLPPEDQAVIDAIQDREAQQAAAAYDASALEKRRARLSAIVAGLGYQLADKPAETAKPDPASTDHRWQIPAHKHDPFVYFIRNGNRLKIGTTTHLRKRIGTLALRAENVVLLLDGGQPLERELHRQFADLRIGNTEWFAYDGPLIDFVHAETARARKEQP